MVKYVKFLRGTPNAYASLEVKDSDTLYFITSEGKNVGKLYLGNILVAGNVTADGANIVDSLGELTDVNLAGLKDNQVLKYDEFTQTWIPTDLSDAINYSIMTGASDKVAGKAGLVPAPASGDQKKFLRGDGIWAEVQGGKVEWVDM